MPVIGLLSGASSDAAATNAAAFRAGLRETGYVESQNVVIDYRWAEGKFERLPSMAADLVGRKVSVILAGGSDTAVRAGDWFCRPTISSTEPSPDDRRLHQRIRWLRHQA